MQSLTSNRVAVNAATKKQAQETSFKLCAFGFLCRSVKKNIPRHLVPLGAEVLRLQNHSVRAGGVARLAAPAKFATPLNIFIPFYL